MDIEIVEPVIHASKANPLQTLLESCIGWPVESENVKRLRPLNECTTYRNSNVKALGGAYWVDRVAVMTPAGKLQKWAECLLLEPGAISGQWTPPIQCFYDHPTKNDIIGIPRFFGLSSFGLPEKDIRTVGDSWPVQNETIDLRPLQAQAVEQTLKSLEIYGGATVIADCGFGKTRLALALSTAIKRRTLILCNRELLMIQWASVFTELLPTLRLSWLQGSVSLHKKTVKVGSMHFLGPSEKHDVCIASIETLIEADVPKTLLSSFGLVIVDECHHLAAATLVHALPLLPARYVVGLSATPDRRDGLEHALYWLSGPASFVYKRLPEITGISNTVEIHKIVADCNNREKMYLNGQMAFAEMLTMLSEDYRRNKIILDILVDNIKCRQKIIVVSGLVAHCVALKEAMTERLQANGFQAALMAGPKIDSELAKLPTTKMVFATYSLLEEGYDDPALDTLILATPRSRIQQTIGRIERSHYGKLKPVVFDVVDAFSVYPSMWAKRKKFYKSRGFNIL